jgi:D-sedoheptulose 7-phosphate isomerase
MTTQKFDSFNEYINQISAVTDKINKNQIELLEKEVWTRFLNKKKIFLCGNGGSAANALHLANDFLYGISKKSFYGIDVEALSSNISVLTCLANDLDYQSIFSEQLKIKSKKGDLLIVLSGSGNSPNIIEALKTANSIGIKTVSIVGFTGGIAKEISDLVIHTPVNDMQISEDIQTMILHYIVKKCSYRFEKLKNE